MSREDALGQYRSLRPAVFRAFCKRARSWNCFLDRRRTCCNQRQRVRKTKTREFFLCVSTQKVTQRLVGVQTLLQEGGGCVLSHLEEHLQIYHTPAQGLSEVEDSVFNGIFLSIQVQDLFVERCRGHDDVINVVILCLVLHLLQRLTQLLVLLLQELNIAINLSLLGTKP